MCWWNSVPSIVTTPSTKRKKAPISYVTSGSQHFVCVKTSLLFPSQIWDQLFSSTLVDCPLPAENHFQGSRGGSSPWGSLWFLRWFRTDLPSLTVTPGWRLVEEGAVQGQAKSFVESLHTTVLLSFCLYWPPTNCFGFLLYQQVQILMEAGEWELLSEQERKGTNRTTGLLSQKGTDNLKTWSFLQRAGESRMSLNEFLLN